MPRLGAGCQSDGDQFALQLCIVDYQSLTEPEPRLTSVTFSFDKDAEIVRFANLHSHHAF